MLKGLFKTCVNSFRGLWEESSKFGLNDREFSFSVNKPLCQIPSEKNVHHTSLEPGAGLRTGVLHPLPLRHPNQFLLGKRYRCCNRETSSAANHNTNTQEYPHTLPFISKKIILQLSPYPVLCLCW